MKLSSDEPTDARVGSDGNNYGAFLNAISWESINTRNITFSAYYPFVPSVGDWETKIYENNDVF